MTINLIKIAYKNLSRHIVKTILTVTAVAVSICLYIFMDAFLYGVDLDSKRNLINYETGSAKIYSKEYFNKKDEKPLYESFGNYEPIIEKLDNKGYFTAPRAVFSGTLMSRENELPFSFIGIDPVYEKNVFRYHLFFDNDESGFIDNNQFKLMLGVKGAKDLDVKVGDDVRLYTIIDIKDKTGKIKHVHQMFTMKIAGIINSPNPKTNGYVAYMPLGILQDEMGIMLNGRITELCIRKKLDKDKISTSIPGKFESPEVIRASLGDSLPDNLLLVSWKEDAKDFLAISTTKTVSNKILISILFILAVIGITNTMLMAIMERTKEIGMIRALGMKDSQIFKLFTYEAYLLGLIGTIMGTIFGCILVYLIVDFGIDYTNIMEQMDMDDFGYRVIGIFRGAWNPSAIVGCIIIGPIISAISAMIPSLKAIKMPIVDCLRFE